MRSAAQIPTRHSLRNVLALLAITAGMLLNPGPAGAQVDAGLLFEPQPLSAALTPTVMAAADSLLPDDSTRQRSGFARMDINSAAEPQATDPDGAVARDDIAAAIGTIEAIEVAEGPYAASLAPRLLELGRLYQRQQEHEKALEGFSRAGQISRVSFGLDTPEQFPAIELGIESHLAMQEYQHALEQQQALVQLYQAHYGPDAPETVPRLAGLGDMYFAAFERTLRKVPGGGGLRMTRGAESGYADPQLLTTDDIAFLWLDQARANYLAAIRLLLKNEDYVNPQLLNLETRVIETLFLLAHRRELAQEPIFFMSVSGDIIKSKQDMAYDVYKAKLYRDGEKALQRMLAYQVSDPDAQPLRIASTMLQLGDWHFLFGHRRDSREAYAQAREFLQINGVSKTDLALLLSPALPVQLPTFISQPHSLETLPASAGNDLSFDGYIDVAFKVSKYGKVTNLKVLDKSANADKAIESRLKKVLRNAPFRPGVADDGDTAEQQYEVRYSFAQL